MHKRICLILLSLSMIFAIFLMTGCGTGSQQDQKNKLDFPLNEKGYPQNNLVVINGKSYPLGLSSDTEVDSVVEIKLDKQSDLVEVLLPQYLTINNWSIGEKEFLDLVSYARIDLPIEKKHMLEGESASVQKFQFQIPKGETTEILLKWSNVDEVEKLFKDKQEDYLLKIVVSD